MDYTLWYKGSYELSPTSTNEHIFGSPFVVEILDGAVYAESSTATGDGLVGGVAGDLFEFTVQAMDVRTTEQQTVRTDAYVVDVVYEVQTVTVEKFSSALFLWVPRHADKDYELYDPRRT